MSQAQDIQRWSGFVAYRKRMFINIFSRRKFVSSLLSHAPSPPSLHQASSRDSPNSLQLCIIVLLVKDVLLQIAAARLSQITHRNTSKKGFCCISHPQGLDSRPSTRIDMSHLGMNHREESSTVRQSTILNPQLLSPKTWKIEHICCISRFAGLRHVFFENGMREIQRWEHSIARRKRIT
jgi:hypothetical protein